MFVLSFLLACFGDTKELTPEEREQDLRARTEDLAQRWEEYAKKKEAQEVVVSDVRSQKEQREEDKAPKSHLEKALEMKESVTQKAKDLHEKSETAGLVFDSLHLALDMEAEGLRQDFAKAKLQVVEIGNHLECELVSTDGAFHSLPTQRFEIHWWYNGEKVSQKASQYCSGASLGIGLNAGGPNCPHHVKWGFYPYMAPLNRQYDDLFQCGMSFTFSMNAQIQKHLADNPFPELTSDAVLWSRWLALKEQTGGPWEFKGTELDCGQDAPQGYHCHLAEE